MTDRAVYEHAVTDRERMRAEVERLRNEIGELEHRLQDIDFFLSLYERYQGSDGDPGPGAPIDAAPPPLAVFPRTDPAEPEPPAPDAAEADVPLIDAHIELHTDDGSRRIAIPPVPLRIGSAEGCDIALPEELGLAPEHALLWQADGEVMLHVVDVDHGATVNDQPMVWASLDHGDLVRLGHVTLRVLISSGNNGFAAG